MRSPLSKLRAGLVAFLYFIFLFLFSSSAFALPPALAVPAGLSIAELKTAGTELIMLINNGPVITNLSDYWLFAYNNTDPSAAGTNSYSQQLPAAGLGTDQAILLQDDGGSTCGAAVTGAVNVTLNDRNGFMEVVKVEPGGGLSVSDSVSWSQDLNDPAMISNIPSNSSGNIYYRYQVSASPAAYAWETAVQDPANSCQLLVASEAVDTVAVNQLLPGSEPPATIVSTVSSVSAGSLPVEDIGLKSPQITELLPNPAGTGTDSTDEFIEVYNPNEKVFNLSGFVLETGLSTKHKYTFPAGTQLPPKSFVSFFSEDTGLTLSNSASRAYLLDPLGATISQSDQYASAKDGQAWALANGRWAWTATPTPGKNNVVSQTGINTVSKTSPKGASVKAASSGAKSAGFNDSTAARPAPVHPWTLAAVAAVALLYGAYEYRNDLAGALHRFGRYRKTRRASGQKLIDWPAFGIGSRPWRRQNNIRPRPGPRSKKRR